MHAGPLRRLALSPLCGCLVLAACAGTATAPPPPQPQAQPPRSATSPLTSGDRDRDTLRAIRAASLSPDQAIAPQNIGKRIRWDGAIHRLAASETDVCLTVQYMPGSEAGAPPGAPGSANQLFNACTKGAYDPALVSEFTKVTIVGRITGTTAIRLGGGATTGPQVEIEKLFRWSDCLEGDTSPVCRYGFVDPVIAGD